MRFAAHSLCERALALSDFIFRWSGGWNVRSAYAAIASTGSISSVKTAPYFRIAGPRVIRKVGHMKPRVAVFKFASCDGCQLQFLNAEDELLKLAGQVDFVYFPEARSRMLEGPYDIAFVEGSITTPDDARRILGCASRAAIW